MPHSPQFNGELLVSMHEPLQLARPPEQPVLQALRSQTCVAEQVVSQSPQRAGLFETSTQAPEQSWKPAAHSTLHSPSVHTAIPPAAVGQALPQAPQFMMSVVASTQLVPQGRKPPWQANEHSESTHTGRP